MGAKATFNATTRIIKLTEAPTLVDGEYRVSINVKADLYGDQKEDWLSTPALRKVRPPISVIGGQATPTGFVGSTFFCANDWSIELYDADQVLTVDGNLYRPDGTSPFIKPSGGTYATQIDRFVSNIVDTLETGTSGLTAAESAILTNIDTNVTYANKIINNYKEVIEITGVKYLVIYDDGETSGGVEILRKPLKDNAGANITDLAAGTLAVEQANTV